MPTQRARYSAGFAFAVGALALILPATFALLNAADEPQIIVTEMRLPTPSSGKKGLEAVMIRPNDSSPHPLALLTHGTPRDEKERAEMTPLRWIPQAREFARRGWTAVIVMRRGYGESGGGYAENGRACSNSPDYLDATKEADKDLLESAAYIRTLPEVDPSRMIAIGVSTGGLSVVGLTADPPPNLMAAISFAGGRGSNAPDHVCNPDSLIAAFAEFGKRSRIPMLWIYASNDHYFGPQIAQAFYRAFTQSGGKASFIAAGPFGEDGHGLFSLRGIPIWTPMVDDFLRSQNLILRDSVLNIPVPQVEPPAFLPNDARTEFSRYLLSAPHKAFVASPTEGIGVSVGQRSTKEAEKKAMDSCKKLAPKTDPCKVVMLDDAKPEN